MAILSNKKKVDIISFLNKEYPNAKCELNYHNDYEFLIAVVLSAQCTDKKVNSVTPMLFKHFNSLKSLNKASYEEIEEIIRPLGLSKNKALAIIDIADKLLNKYNSKMPSIREDLMSFKGVGVKTANLVRAEIFLIPEFPVDTHVFRISKRLAISKEDANTLHVERDLHKFFDEKDWIRLHHQFIHFGRGLCKAQNPDCEKCELKKYCNYYQNKDKLSKTVK